MSDLAEVDRLRTEKIGITLGDPAGIGPEVVAKALCKFPGVLENVIVFGNLKDFTNTINSCNLDLSILKRIEFHDIPGNTVSHGKAQKDAGKIALSSIKAAVKSALDDEISAICTAPINKESIIMAGSRDIDHTVMLARLTGSSHVSTVFESRRLRILFANKHIPLRQAVTGLTKIEVLEAIDMCAYALEALGSKRKRIAVAALNPHAGENGLLGNEEIEIIGPAVKERSGRFDVSGPFPADSVFYRASKGEFDIVLSLYHDQGHIAAKMLDFHGTVSMNLGLPFLRTSVDHGTAYEIAGRNMANPSSMIAAIKTTFRYAKRYGTNYKSTLR